MNILLVSQCQKNALTETRRILDQFAPRIGERTWMTPITEKGLQTLHQLLRKSARKNTAVACHYVRSKNRTELLWIVGDANQFDSRGQVPTHTTRRAVAQVRENDWYSQEWLKHVTRMAALFHDFGKANAAFQAKINPDPKNTTPKADALRHEWVSLRLFEALVRVSGPLEDDRAWLTLLAKLHTQPPGAEWLESVLAQMHRDQVDAYVPERQHPIADLPPLARLVGWLVVSHHRLPLLPNTPKNGLKGRLNSPEGLWGGFHYEWSFPNPQASEHEKAHCWQIAPADLPLASNAWRQHCGPVAAWLLQAGKLTYGYTRMEDSYTHHVGRLALMLADHHYSGQQYSPRPQSETTHDPAYQPYANTRFEANAKGDKERVYNQPLDDHLIGVNQAVRQLMGQLPYLAEQLPRLVHKRALRSHSKHSRFGWQNRAFDLAQQLQAASAAQGFFGVNMASTGCGKTLANARIVYGLADPAQGARFCIALGLRTLTLQTGRVLGERMHLDEFEQTVLVGGGAVRALHEHLDSVRTESPVHALQTEFGKTEGLSEARAAQLGSESLASLDEPDSFSVGEIDLPEGSLLARWLDDHPDIRKLLAAPVLTCTIDHLIPATESLRGGHQIAPMLRLMTSDLILDEPDDFGIEDLYALSRLVYWAGLLGSRVLLSSATLDPATVAGLFEAYRAGRNHYRRHRVAADVPNGICCAWFDENGCSSAEPVDSEHYLAEHGAFVARRVQFLAQQPQRRNLKRVELVPNVSAAAPIQIKGLSSARRASRLAQPAQESLPDLWVRNIAASINTADTQNRSPVENTQKTVSIGLLRMANIDALVSTATALIQQVPPADTRWHVLMYHSRLPLLCRSALEHQLDGLLDRTVSRNPAKHAWVQQALAEFPEQHHVFILCASPVAEVGRDWDLDWAVVEPSSMRSMIQLLGRVRRHRAETWAHPNVWVLDTNWRTLKLQNLNATQKATFSRPGFEHERLILKVKQLGDLLTASQWQHLDARHRIVWPAQPAPLYQLADLELARLSTVMLGQGLPNAPDIEATEGSVQPFWQHGVHLTGIMQHAYPFRCSQPEEIVAWTSDAPDEPLVLRQFEPRTQVWRDISHMVSSQAMSSLQIHPQVTLWPRWTPAELLENLELDSALPWRVRCQKYLSLTLPMGTPESPQRWCYGDWSGFSRLKHKV